MSEPRRRRRADSTLSNAPESLPLESLPQKEEPVLISSPKVVPESDLKAEESMSAPMGKAAFEHSNAASRKRKKKQKKKKRNTGMIVVLILVLLIIILLVLSGMYFFSDKLSEGYIGSKTSAANIQQQKESKLTVSLPSETDSLVALPSSETSSISDAPPEPTALPKQTSESLLSGFFSERCAFTFTDGKCCTNEAEEGMTLCKTHKNFLNQLR